LSSKVVIGVSKIISADLIDHDKQAGRGAAKIVATGLMSGAADALVYMLGRERAAEEIYRLADRIVADGAET